MSEQNVDNWTIYLHPLLTQQIENLTQKVEKLKEKSPNTYTSKKEAKILAAIQRLIYQDIPEDPARPKYRQGNTLGEDRKEWRRAKFFQQYRLFFRYFDDKKRNKVIVFAWVNDEKTKRAYGSKTDAYKVFSQMLDRGNPPDSWDELLGQSEKQDN